MASTSKRARLDCQHETDDESEKNCDEKRAKKKPVFQKCREEYFQTWPFFKPSPKGEGMIYCKICDRHFSIKHGGAYDCERHIRIFLQVRQNKTEQRAALLNDTLESLLVMKSRPGVFGERQFSAAELSAIKSAYSKSFKSKH